MKIAILTINCCFLLCFVYAQQPAILIKGCVIDSLKKQPLPYATVALTDTQTHKVVKSILTKEYGNFELSPAINKAFQLSFIMVGYQTKIISLPSSSNTTIDLGNILLSASLNTLKEVVVTSTVVKPIITRDVDRINYDVQADPENNATNVLDMLRKVPLVSVDATDNIKLMGNGNYKILINGKPSALLAKNPSDILKAMPASNIQKIEVITTPPAKYEAEGLSGIINIITKKNLDQGYNGNLNTNYNTVYGPGINFNGTLKQGKFGLNGYMGYNHRNKQTTENGYTNYIISPVITNLSQQGFNFTSGHNIYGSVELSYEIDSLNLLTASVEHYTGTNDQGSNQLSTLSDASYRLIQSYQLSSKGNNNYAGTDLSLNYQLAAKKNKEQLLTTSYKYSFQNNKQFTDAMYSDKIFFNYPDYRQYNNSGTKEHTVQLDYVYPAKTVTIEAGTKAILRNIFSNFNTDNFDSAWAQYITNPSQTNNFNYRQNVYSAYNSYQVKWKNLVFKGGLRLEHTTVDADFTSTRSSIKQDYNNLIPSLSLQVPLKGRHKLNLGFTNRIQRPGIWQLNPFIDKSNPQVINVGNPNLQPVIRHSMELSYSNFAKGSVTIGVNYAFANNTVENVTSVGVDTVTTNTYQNVGKIKRLAFTLNGNYPVTKNLSITLNSQLVHVWLKGTYNGEFYNNQGFQGFAFLTSGYTFNKGYHAGFDIGYDSRYVLLQGKDNDYFYFSFSGSKELFNKKVIISAYVSNPLNKFLKIDFYTTTKDFEQYNYYDIYSRRINISIKYKFGKLNSSIKKNERSISNDDVGGRSSH